MKISYFARITEIQHGTLLSWLGSYKFSKFVNDKDITISAEFFDTLENFIINKAKKDSRMVKYIDTIRKTKRIFITPHNVLRRKHCTL